MRDNHNAKIQVNCKEKATTNMKMKKKKYDQVRNCRFLIEEFGGAMRNVFVP